MSPRRIVAPHAWGALAASVALLVGGTVLTWRLGLAINVPESVTLNAAYLAIGVIGALVATRHPRNPVGWMLLGVTALTAVSYAGGEYLYFLVAERGIDVPGIGVLAVLSPFGWGMSGGLILLILHVFPDGRALSRRWAWVLRAGIVGLSCAGLAILLSPTAQVGAEIRPGVEHVDVVNPLGQLVGPVVHRAFETAAPILLLPVVALTPVVVFLRYRRSHSEARQQMKWLVYGIALLVLGIPVLGGGLSILGLDAGGLLFALGITALPAAIGTAILRNRLYDIDVVISRTVVFAGLAGFITAVYVGIVVGVGALIGAGDEPNLALSIAATALVAVAFQPVRVRLTQVANRLVYGRRAEPYEVLSRFAAHLGEAPASEATLQEMARLLAEGTGAAQVQVWLRVRDELRAAATWPAHMTADSDPRPLEPSGGLPAFAGVDRAVPVVHEGELLGAITVAKRRGEAVTPVDESLLSDLAGQAGLVLRNLRLTAELQARIAELRDSRRRLVEAQDAERRRLERDLHDGAQQQLVALKMKLGLARRLADQEQAPKAGQLLDQLNADSDDAVATLRELAHGIYPPLLAAEGLPAALAAQARKAPLPVSVDTDGVGRYPQDVEAAVYFCVLEALQNAAKYAAATQVTVHLADTGGQLHFTVTDDGAGFDPTTTPRGHGTTNMADRLDALDGHLTITSTPGRGTTITGTVPLVGDAPA